ncbi:hypothetical protein NMG60_11024266 [Bertholletia excelsa]
MSNYNCNKMAVPYSEDDIRKLLIKHDQNKDNRLSRREIQNVFIELNAHFPWWRAWRGLANCDHNGDGYVDEDEMKDLVQYILTVGYTVS